MKEKWEYVDGHTEYEVSNYGVIVSTMSEVEGRPRVLTQHINNTGALVVTLDWGTGNASRSVRKIVAQAFVPNPKNHRYVAVIDGDIYNNRSDNLMWVNTRELKWYQVDPRFMSKIQQLDRNRNIVHIFDSILDADHSRFYTRGVAKAIRLPGSEYKGFVWRFDYVTDVVNIITYNDYLRKHPINISGHFGPASLKWK